jgi:peptidoglycan/LPS O-acetylase OafA/YrhL
MSIPPISDQQKKRFAFLDGMRGWAALLVVLNHGTIAIDFALYTGQPAHSQGFWDLRVSGTPFFPLAPGGSLAVCIFFSGFVLAHAYSRSQQNWLALAVRRFVRLGIPMLAGCLLSWLLLVLGLMQNQPAGAFTRSTWLSGQFHQAPDLIAAASEPIWLLLGSGTSFATSYDSSLWTMPIEFGASLVLMTIFVLLRYVRRRSDRFAGYAFCVLAVLCIGSFFSLFAFGAALRLLQPQRALLALGRSRWCLGVVLGLALFFGTVPFSAERWPIYN